MLSRFIRSLHLLAVAAIVLATVDVAEAHVVPNMTIEASFAADSTYTLRINVDPRTFLAADPTTLPPVPGSWYQEQTPAQIAATQEKAREYLSRALGLIFDGQKVPLPTCEIQMIDGEDNTPLKPDTQEIHLLATTHGSMPAGAGSFQIDFSKAANTTLILLQSHKGSSEMRPQVVFPGETTRPFALHGVGHKPTGTTTSTVVSPLVSDASSRWVVVVLCVTLLLLIQGWRLLRKHRHHHRGHRKPRQDTDVNN